MQFAGTHCEVHCDGLGGCETMLMQVWDVAPLQTWATGLQAVCVPPLQACGWRLLQAAGDPPTQASLWAPLQAAADPPVQVAITLQVPAAPAPHTPNWPLHAPATLPAQTPATKPVQVPVAT